MVFLLVFFLLYNFIQSSVKGKRGRTKRSLTFYLQLLILARTILSGTHGVAAAVDGEVDSGDEAGRVRRQEGDALGHFVHLAWSAQRVGLLALGKKLNRGKEVWEEDF